MKYLNIIVLFSIFLSTSCKRDRETSWDTKVKGPLINTSLNINNLLGDEYLAENPDSSLKLVYNQNFKEIEIDSLYQFNDTLITFGASLQSLKLDNIILEETITIEQIASSDPASAFFVNLLHNRRVATDDFNFNDANTFDINSSELFESMILESAEIKITFTNDLPLDIENLNLEIRNAPELGGELIFSKLFPLIPANSSVEDSSTLTDITIFNKLEGKLVSLVIAGSRPDSVLFNKFDEITAKIEISNIKPKEAKAIWPAQNIIDTTFSTFLVDENGFKLSYMKVRSGEIIIDAFSSLEDSLYITYTVPNLTKNGIPFEINSAIPPAKNNVFGSIKKSFSFEGYDFDLKGDGDTINTFSQNIIGRIQYTGEMKTLRKSDTVYIKAGVQSVDPEYAEGYMGKQTVSIGLDEIGFNIFDRVKSGKINLEDVKMDIEIENGIGAGANAKIKQLISVNKNGNEVLMTGSGVENEVFIPTSTKTGNPLEPVNFSIANLNLSKSNSNITSFIENFPSLLKYEIEFNINSNIITEPTIAEIISSTPPNFIYYGKWISANVKMEIPLSFMADSLLLTDTIDFNYQQNSTSNYNDGNFNLIVDNDFPFNAYVTLLLADENGNVNDTLLVKGEIEKSLINPSNGKTIQSKQSVIKFNISSSLLSQMENSKKIIALVGFHTNSLPSASDKNVKIYSSYNFNIQLTGDVNFTIKN